MGFVLLLVTVSKQLLPFLDKAFTNHHHPPLQVVGYIYIYSDVPYVECLGLWALVGLVI